MGEKMGCMTKEECMRGHRKLWTLTKKEYMRIAFTKSESRLLNRIYPMNSLKREVATKHDMFTCYFCVYSANCSTCPVQHECSNWLDALDYAQSYLERLHWINRIIALNPWNIK